MRKRVLATAAVMTLTLSGTLAAGPAQAAEPSTPAQPSASAVPSAQLSATYWELINDHAKKCADVEGQSKTVGANVHEWSCEDDSNQQWQQLSLGNNYFLLRNRNSGYCMGVRGHADVEGAGIEQQPCDTGDVGQWWQQRIAYGLLGYWLANGYEGRCLSLYPNTSKNGTAIVLGTNSDTTAKYWHFQYSTTA